MSMLQNNCRNITQSVGSLRPRIFYLSLHESSIAVCCTTDLESCLFLAFKCRFLRVFSVGSPAGFCSQNQCVICSQKICIWHTWLAVAIAVGKLDKFGNSTQPYHQCPIQIHNSHAITKCKKPMTNNTSTDVEDNDCRFFYWWQIRWCQCWHYGH